MDCGNADSSSADRLFWLYRRGDPVAVFFGHCRNHNCITGRIRRREQHRGNSRNFCRRNGSRNGNCGNHSAETTTVPEAGADTSEYAAAAKTLFGALNYIDQIGSGNLPKDETDTIQTTKSGVTYERVTKTQFSSTADLKAYMTASLTQKMIDSRYAAILGTDKPLYIDANGGLYGRQYATSGGFTWIDPEQVTISNATDSSFTASMQYDNFGAADTLTVQIVLDNGLWKIDSMQ